MRTFQFTITGNHKSKTGNAVPKLKMTGKQHWTPKAQEYVKWKGHVIYSFLEKMRGDKDAQRLYATNIARFGKPFILNNCDYALMILKIYWSNKAHGDPENIFGSIADALFKNDKHLDVMAFSRMADETLNGKPWGRVDATVMVFANEKEKIDFINKNYLK